METARLFIMTNLIALLISLGDLSCTKCNKFDNIITNCKYRYWSVYSNDYLENFGVYRFDIDNSLYYLKYTGKQGCLSRVLFGTEDVYVSNSWCELDSNKIALNHVKYDVLYISDDTLSLVPDWAMSKLLKKDSVNIKNLILSKDQTDCINFDSLKTSSSSHYSFKGVDFNNKGNYIGQ